MFAQVIVAEHAEDTALAAVEQWMDEVRPGAVGWLGCTAGVTDRGELVLLARFDSEGSALHNSARPEQDAWWRDIQERLRGHVTIHDCPDVALVLEGGSDEAGFVQVIEGRPDEPTTAVEVADQASRLVREHRPDVLGGLVAAASDGTFFEVVYFTSESEARANEKQQRAPEAQAEADRLMARFGALRYYDLRAPMLLG
jgi:hypothetical protein